MTKYFAVALQQNRMIVLKKIWIQNPVIGEYTKVFISPNEESVAKFFLKTKYLLDASADNCYNARVIKDFGSKEEADKFVCWKRPEYYQSGNKRFNFYESTVVAKINIDISDVSNIIESNLQCMCLCATTFLRKNSKIQSIHQR